MKAKRTTVDVKMVIEDWKRRIGNRPSLFSQEIQQAMVAECVMYLMVLRSEEYPNRPMGDYAKLYAAVCDVLFPDLYDKSE